MKLRYIILLFIVLSAIKVFGQKQSLYAQYPSLVFREVFNSEYDTRFNQNPTLTATTFSQGAINLNGTSSYFRYNTSYYNATRTIVIRMKSNSFANVQVLADFRKQLGSLYGSGLIYIETNRTITVSSGTVYVDGVAGTTYPNDNNYHTITVSGMTILGLQLTIGANYGNVGFLNGSIDYIEIYNRALSASEISNMYLGVHHKDLTLTPLIDFNSTSGMLKDFRGNTITNTATTIKRAGSIWSADFNGSTSKLDFGNIDPLTGDITICGWVKARGWGGGAVTSSRILDNSKLFWGISLGAGSTVLFTRDAATLPTAASNAIKFNKSYFLVMTSTSAGVTNFYIGDTKTPPTLSGTANQSSGTPVAGTTNITIGNRSAGDRTFNGLIPFLRVYKNTILTQAQLTQLWSWSLNGGSYYGD